MQEEITAFLIDPETQTITAVVFNPNGNLGAIYDLLNARPIDFASIIGPSGQPLTLIVDDEGLLRDTRFHFTLKGNDTTFTNRALLLATTDDGDLCSPDITLDDAVAFVTFLPDIELKGIRTFQQTIRHPIFGPMTSIQTKASFGPKDPEKKENDHKN